MKENVWIEVTLMFSPQLWNWVIGYQKQLAVGCHRLLFYKENKTALELARGQKYQHFLWSSPFGFIQKLRWNDFGLFFEPPTYPCLRFLTCLDVEKSLTLCDHLPTFSLSTCFLNGPHFCIVQAVIKWKKLTIFGKKIISPAPSSNLLT